MDKEEYLMMVENLKKKGYEDAEAIMLAKLMLKAVDEEDNKSSDDIAKVADVFETIKDIPPEGRDKYVQYVLSKVDKSGDDDFTKQLQKMILTIKTMDMLGKKDDEGKEYIAMLASKLENLEQKLEEKNKEKEESKVDRLEQEIQQLRSDIVNLLQNGFGPQEKRSDDIVDEAAEFAEKLQKMKAVLEQFEGPQRKGDISEAVEQLKAMGYEIKEPPSWGMVQKMMREEMDKLRREYDELIKKREEEIRKQAEQEAYKKAGLEKHKQRMLVDLFSALLNTVVSVSKSSGARKEVSSWGDMLRNVAGGFLNGGGSGTEDTGASDGQSD